MKAELVFTRFFPPMSNDWGTYLKAWDRARTDKEAFGLLYAGVSGELSRRIEHDQQFSAISTQERVLHDKELTKRLKFYLSWATNGLNPKIASVARQIIVKYWIKLCKSSLTPSSTHLLLIDFLRVTYPSLWEPPYPRFVSDYLLWLFEKRPEGILIEDFVRVFIDWGMGYILADKRELAFIPLIEGYLKENNYNPEEFILRSISGLHKFEPVNSLSQVEFQSRLIRAACALIKLKAMDGYVLAKPSN